MWLVQFNCDYCGKLFTPRKDTINSQKHFCSLECRYNFPMLKYKPWSKSWKLTIIWVVDGKRKNGYRLLKCKCECWKDTEITTAKWGITNSCWCSVWSQHRMSHSPEYKARNLLYNRCNSKSTTNYMEYGWRWIKVWFKNFDEFYAYMWPKPWKEYTVDRIDNNKWYEPWNVRWATMKEQENNRRNNVRCIINWEEHTLQERADKLWIKRWTLKRYILNWRIKWVLYNYKDNWRWH